MTSSFWVNYWTPLFLKEQVMKTVDRFLAGRAPIAEYKDDSFASDSDDSKKIRQAENKAPAKNKNQNPL